MWAVIVSESMAGNRHASVLSKDATDADRPGRPPTSKES
jgi:hypothetical protein